LGGEEEKRSGRGLIWEMLEAWKRGTAHDGADRGLFS